MGVRAADQEQQLTAAPEGSGFEAGALSNDGASLLIRTMIAAAAADGRIDASERQRILGSLRQAGSSVEAQRFLMQEGQRPASRPILPVRCPRPNRPSRSIWPRVSPSISMARKARLSDGVGGPARH
jgi:hypothetical protein